MRSPHPGVVLIPPDADHAAWRARYTDPDTGKVKKVRLDPVAISTTEARREWAIRKSKALGKRGMELDHGAARATGGALADALDTFFKSNATLRPATLELYRSARDKLLAWASSAGVDCADDLNRAKLTAFRAYLVAQPRRARAPGGKRGATKPTATPRSPHTINGDLRKTGTMLLQLIDADLLPRLSRDDIRRALRKLLAPTERLDFLRPHECQSLLEAALRHDARAFAETREEHKGARPVGTTLRYDPIAPFVATVLFTGMRLNEALDLDWEQVELDALDHDGRKVGEIHLKGAETKTHKARTIGLEVSPALHKLLAAMHLASGGRGRVFALTEGVANTAAKRLRDEYGAPKKFTWQCLRRTCGTYLTNAPGIFGGASAYRSAAQLGHSVQVAQKSYINLARGIPREARTLEAAMQVEDVVQRVIAAAQGHNSESTPAGASIARLDLRSRTDKL